MQICYYFVLKISVKKLRRNYKIVNDVRKKAKKRKMPPRVNKKRAQLSVLGVNCKLKC